MKKILSIIAMMGLSIPSLAETNVPLFETADSAISTYVLVPLIDIIIERSGAVMQLLIMISVVFIILDVMFYALRSMIEEKYTNFVSNMVNRAITYMMLIYIMSNWFTGNKIFINYIFNPIFIYLPNYLTGRKIDLNLIWDLLMSIPKLIYDSTLAMISVQSFISTGWLILLLILISVILFIQAAFLYLKLVTSILHIFIIALFSFLTFPLNFVDKLSARYGGVMIKTYLILMMQYTIMMIILIVVSDTGKNIHSVVVGGGAIINMIFAPIVAMILLAVSYLLLKFTNKATDMVVNISNNM